MTHTAIIVEAYLLIRHTAAREHPVCLANLVFPATAGRILQVAFKPLDDISTTVRRRLQQIAALQVVYLDL